jgi:hypothetical protein
MIREILGLVMLCLALMAAIQVDRGISLSELISNPTRIVEDIR